MDNAESNDDDSYYPSHSFREGFVFQGSSCTMNGSSHNYSNTNVTTVKSRHSVNPPILLDPLKNRLY